MAIIQISGPREEYRLVEIRVFASINEGESYPVELEVAEGSPFPLGTLQLDQARLMELAADPRAYGQALGEMLFAATAIGAFYQETVAVLQGRGEELRLHLRLDPPELYTLGWERLMMPHDGAWQPLAATAATPFSRYVLVRGWERPAPVTERPLRLLVVIASPAGLEEFGLDPIPAEEWQSLHTLLDELPDMAVSYLESGTAMPPTLNNLRAALAEAPHLVHFLCHGAATAGGSVLYLEDESGGVGPVGADRLLEAFALVKTPPLLCFLAACETARRGRHDAFVPLGPALVERGVQAVVAMSDLVGLETARLFTSQFYNRLLKHGLADLAMNEARALVQDEWDWGVPVLFCRIHHSQLVDFPAGKPVAELGGLATTMHSALEVARREDHGEQLVQKLERLLAAFEESFKNLVKWGTEFRTTGSDPATFPEKFEEFYPRFKEYYDLETFSDEQALLRQMIQLKAETLLKLQPLLEPEAFETLKEELDRMQVNRQGLIQGFGEYLEPLNTAVEEIKGLLDGGDIPGAIAKKRDFEAQISPSLRRSKELLGQISSGINTVQAV